MDQASDANAGENDQAERQVIDDVATAMRTTLKSAPLGCLGVLALFWWVADRRGLIIGLAMVFCGAMFAAARLTRFDKHPNKLRLLVGANCLACCAWGALFILMMPDQADQQLFVMALPFACLIVNIADVGASRPIYLAGQIPTRTSGW